MGYLYELASTPSAYVKPAYYDAHPPQRSNEPVCIPFGSDKQQHCVLWEPDEVRCEAPVFYFHGGGYVFGEPESLIDAANAYNSQGYRFCSVGFRTAPRHRFPSMVTDAFTGVRTAMEWMEETGCPCERIIVGGTSAGGHLAMLPAYGRELQRVYDFLGERISACISIAGVADAADLLLKPFPTYAAWRTQVGLHARGRTREDMRRALEPYSPIALVQRDSKVPAVPLFVAHGRADTLSPYASQARFVECVRAKLGSDSVEFITLEGRQWQHMNTTVTMYKDAVDESLVLSALFRWLTQQVPPSLDMSSIEAQV